MTYRSASLLALLALGGVVVVLPALAVSAVLFGREHWVYLGQGTPRMREFVTRVAGEGLGPIRRQSCAKDFKSGLYLCAYSAFEGETLYLREDVQTGKIRKITLVGQSSRKAVERASVVGQLTSLIRAACDIKSPADAQRVLAFLGFGSEPLEGVDRTRAIARDCAFVVRDHAREMTIIRQPRRHRADEEWPAIPGL
jgi:hypothetical protein